ncbi:hypothetical protein B0H19DRAFT_1072087 [Mycena capillaripes]|nr:hypothetical protein B0H19DRAFT_1072087 [Mycena capillaripes]
MISTLDNPVATSLKLFARLRKPSGTTWSPFHLDYDPGVVVPVLLSFSLIPASSTLASNIKATNSALRVPSRLCGEPPVATRWLPKHAVPVAPQMMCAPPKMSHRMPPGQPPDDVALQNGGEPLATACLGSHRMNSSEDPYEAETPGKGRKLEVN